MLILHQFIKRKTKVIRPVSILTNASKTYENLIHNQLYDYFDDIISPIQLGFRKVYSTQHCLLVMLKKFKESVDKDNEFGALLTDLSKAFDCIDQKLSITELFWCGVSPSALNLVFYCLSNRTQRVKIKTSYSDKSSIEYGVPEGSIVGALLFNFDLTVSSLNVMFLKLKIMPMIQLNILVLMTYVA